MRAAKEAGLAFVALTDHDTICGVPEAMQEGARIGMRVIPGVEFDIDYHVTMHILGLGVNPEAEELKATLAESAQKRARRNAAMLARLSAVSYTHRDVYKRQKQPRQPPAKGNSRRFTIRLSKGSAARKSAIIFARFSSEGA